MPRPPLTDLRAQRIALLKPSALGDIIHSLPVLSALRTRFPEAHITWVTNRAYAGLLAGHPDLNEVLSFDRRMGLAGVARFGRELFRRQFDLVIDLQGLLRTGLMALATRAPRRVGLAGAREGSRYAYTDMVPVPDGLHAVDRYWLMANALGAGGTPKKFLVPTATSARVWAQEHLAGLPRPWLVVAPGSRWLTKRWPIAGFAELTRRAQQRFGGSAILIGAADDESLTQALKTSIGPDVLDLAGNTTLPQLAAVLSRADVVLANDSGPLHLAAALGRPVVAPYTCTQIRLHGPYGQSGGIESRIYCQGSYLKRCARLDCMSELTPDRLWPVLEGVLCRWAVTCRSA